MKKYIVYDTENQMVGVPFDSYKDAYAYKALKGRFDWNIRETYIKFSRNSTTKQRAAIHFVEEWCNITFEGDINNFYEVSDFLSDYLDAAKEIAEDAQASYLSMLYEH